MGSVKVRDFFALKAALINVRTSAVQSRKDKYSTRLQKARETLNPYFTDASRDTFAEDYLLAESHIARILGKESTYNKKVIAVK